jgi:hypothetical protein
MENKLAGRIFTGSPGKEGLIIEESSRRLFHNVYVRENPQGLTARRMAELLTTKGERRFYSSKKGCPAILLSHCRYAFLIKLIPYLTLRLSFFSRSRRPNPLMNAI